MSRKLLLTTAVAAIAAGTLSLALPATPAQAAGWTDPFVLTADNSGFGTMKIVSTGAGDAVAAWIDGDGDPNRVRARIATDGVWGPPTWVSPQGIEAAYVELETNDAGDVVATWVSKDDGVNWKPRGARLDDDGTWDPSITLWHLPVVYAPLMTGIDGDDTVRVAFRAEVAGKTTVQVRTWEPGQATTGKVIAPEFGMSVGLDVNEAGQAVLAYGTDQSIDGVYATEFTPGVGWGEPEQVSFLTDHGRDAEPIIDGSGRSTILFLGKVGDDSGDWRVHANTENANGSDWTVPVMISAPTRTASYLSADTDPSGRTLAAWQTTVNGADYDAAYASRPSTAGAWNAAVSLNTPDPTWPNTYPEVSVGDQGTQVIDYTSGPSRITKYRSGPALSFSTLNHGSGYEQLSYSIDADVDDDGNAALIERWDPEEGFDEVRVRMYDLAGPTTALTKPGRNTTRRLKIPVAWTATDDVSGVATTDVSVTGAAWNEVDFGPGENAIDDSTDDHGIFVGVPGTTYCFAARSTDVVGNLGATSAARCSTLPVDDASLTGGDPWNRVAGAKGHFLKTYSSTKEKGAKLVLKGVKARRLALVIFKTANGGKAVVKLGTETLKTVKFAGTGKRKIVPLALFDEVRTGKVTITVITDGKRVDVDGLIVAK